MASIGEAVHGFTLVANNSVLAIQPTGTEEWTIHNIVIPNGTQAELYVTNGTNDIKVSDITGSWLAFYWHVTNGYYIKVKNVSGASAYFGYDGVVTKL